MAHNVDTPLALQASQAAHRACDELEEFFNRELQDVGADGATAFPELLRSYWSLRRVARGMAFVHKGSFLVVSKGDVAYEQPSRAG